MEPEFPYEIKISWRKGDTIMSWDEKCAWVLENLGSPGDRYVFHAHSEYMTFCTKTQEDACFIALKCC